MAPELRVMRLRCCNSSAPAAGLATAERWALFAMVCMVAGFAAVRCWAVVVMVCACLAKYTRSRAEGEKARTVPDPCKPQNLGARCRSKTGL